MMFGTLAEFFLFLLHLTNVNMVQEVDQHREELGSATFYDVGYIPEKRVSWTDRSQHTGQVSELMTRSTGHDSTG